ncbi:hypothetical protein J7T55_007374 [Diaporthe amygdali]|uniref:uncharacterized protein n=1 Tax=Phomopsis amygdali TaxID=1214568 RepID=UPI0022FE5536|nr:uncharacterized protein J7T55_007374 [Diaporthe amygdali]KAJ0116394.1 hypothetical protein J7T55_007374 [Diaporthe amygdali]
MASTNVNKPVDLKLKEADVNRKLQIYGIATAFQNGKVPSNDQIDVALNSFLASKALSSPADKLSTEGKALVKDFREVVTQAKNLLLSKNEGNLLQDFIWQTTQFDPNAVSTPNAPVNKETAQQHGDKALQGLRTLGTLIITNGQFRKLLNDASILLRDIAGDAATNAAGKVRPGEERLAQIDRPADDNTWHDAPDFSKQNIKSQLQKNYKGNDPQQDAQHVAGNAATAAQNQSVDSGVNVTAGVDAAKQTAHEKTGLTEQDTEEAKQAANQRAAEYRAKTLDYLKRKIPQERREQTIWRLKKMILECQQHPDYQEAITTLLDLAEQYGGHANTLAQGGTGTVKGARSSLAQAEADLKTLIERFANGTSSDDLWSSVNQIYEDAQRDPELKDWFKSVDKYIRRSLQEQGYILEEASTQEWNKLYDHGDYLLRQKYKTHTDRVIDEIKFLAGQFDEDAQNKQFAVTVEKLFTDLGNDENGKPTFKPHLVKDLTEVILPAVFENIAYIPVPRIEYSDPQVDAVIENLVLESDNFTPNLLEINSENHMRWGRKKVSSKHQHAFEIKVSGVQMDLRDVSFYVKKKQGFPSITDQGVMDIILAGEGFGFTLKMSSADKKDSQNFFKVDKVDVNINNMKLKVKKSKHKLLFAIAKPIALKAMRPAIQKAAEKAIKDNFNQADAFLKKVQVEANRALEEAREDPQNAPNVYKRYVDAFQKQLLQGKKKAEAAVADKKVNYAITQEDSIFKDIKLPGGISSKATEYKELARKGEKWESPVFSIGSAKTSTNIPPAPKVTRKPHTTGTAANGPSTNGSSTFADGNIKNDLNFAAQNQFHPNTATTTVS